MSYINDPREMTMKSQDGVILERDNRSETMYHWGAMVTDLCGLPVSEYMKPMTVIVLGSGENVWPDPDNSAKTEDVKIWFTILENGNPVKDEKILGASENGDDVILEAKWQWKGDFPGTIQVAASIQTDTGVYSISEQLQDNAEKTKIVEFDEAMKDGSTTILSYSSYGIGSIDSSSEEIVNTPIYSETINGKEYKYEISTDESIIYVTLKATISGNIVYINKTIKGGDLIDLSSISTNKEGYNFIGWYDESGKEYKNGDKMPVKDLILNAKYDVKQCTVKFVFDYGNGQTEEISSVIVNYGNKVTSIPTTSKEGYKFLGWDNNPSVATIKDDTTFTASFEILTFEIIWIVDSKEILKRTYNYGDTLNIPEDPEKEGYSFNKWLPNVSNVVKSSVEYSAQFTINKYKVEYFIEIDGEQGAPISSLTLTYGETIPSKPILTERGYDYSPWKGYNSETKEAFVGENMPAFDLKYVSTRTAKSFVLAYYDNKNLIEEQTYLYGATITPFKYEKEGWTVSEWTNIPETMPYYNVSAHCTSTINQYKVTFKDGNGKILQEVEADYGTMISTLIPIIEGHTYEIPDDVVNTTLGSSDMIIIGKLTVNEYNVSISVNGVTENVKLPFGTNIKEYVEENYSAENGYSMTITTNNDTVPGNDNTVVEISYEANKWTLSYETTGADGKNIIGNTTVAFGQSILNNLPDTNIDGYEFSGWFNEGIKVTETDTMPDKNIIVNGVFTIKTYTVEVKDGDYTILSKSYNHGTKFEEVLNDELVRNYITTSFENGYDVTIDIDSNLSIVNDMVIEVTKTEREFELTFKNGNEIISSSKVKFNSIINYPIMNNKVENGIEYVFIWEDESYNGKLMPKNDVVIVGSYQEKPEALIYYGVFVTSSTTADSRIFNTADLDSNFKTVKVNDCFDGEDVIIEMPADEYLLNPELTDDEFEEYQEKHLYPACFLIPVEIDNKYEFISVLKSDNKQKNFTTDNVEIVLNGNSYHLYSYLNPKSMRAMDRSQNWKYNIILK